MRALAAELAGLDLTASEINAVANLADGHARTVSELGATAGVPAITMTSALGRLERRCLAGQRDVAAAPDLMEVEYRLCRIVRGGAR